MYISPDGKNCGFQKGYSAYMLHLKYKDEVGNPAVEKSLISVFPNPATDRIFVSGEEFDMVKLYDINGREVISRTANSNTIAVNLDNLASGIYIVKIMLRGKTVAVEKIVKN
jgi:hypothetical protein